MAGEDQQFCLRWNNFPNNFTSQFDELRHDESFVDVTLTCEGRRIKAHKLVLSACSPYFKQLFKGNPCKHPIMFLHNVEFRHLKSIVEFMYVGEVNVAQMQLPEFLRTAESLQIRGLADNHAKFTNGRSVNSVNINTSSKRRDDSFSQLSDNGDETDEFPNSLVQTKRIKHSRSSVDHLSQSVPAKLERRDFSNDLLDAANVMNPFFGLETTVEAVNTGGLTLQGALDAATAAVPSTSQHGENSIHHNSNSESSASESEVVKPHSLDPRPCPECGRVYSNISNLRQHIRLIHYPECIACPLCFKPFKNKLYLKRHLISYHELLPPSYMEKRYSGYGSQQNATVVANAGSPVFTYKSQPPDGFLQRHGGINNNGSNVNCNSNNSNNNGSTNNESNSNEPHHPAIHHALGHHIQHSHPSAHHMSNNIARDSVMNHINFSHANHIMPVQAVLSSPPQNFYPPNAAGDYSGLSGDSNAQQSQGSSDTVLSPTGGHVHNAIHNDHGGASNDNIKQSFSPQSGAGGSNAQLEDSTNNSDLTSNSK